MTPHSLADIFHWWFPPETAAIDGHTARERAAVFAEAEARGTTPYALYRYFDHHCRLLYVGITNDPERRQKNQLYGPFAPFATTRTRYWYPSPEEARIAELRAIKTEFPIFNEASVTELTKKLHAEYMACTANQLRMAVARAKILARSGIEWDLERELSLAESIPWRDEHYTEAIRFLGVLVGSSSDEDN